jgi:hypothetical protein
MRRVLSIHANAIIFNDLLISSDSSRKKAGVVHCQAISITFELA